MKSLYFIIYDMSEMGGIQGVIVKMANALADRGYDVHIVSMVLRETIPWGTCLLRWRYTTSTGRTIPIIVR